jgi:hypothetical protein
LTRPGTKQFGAVVVNDVGEGLNQSLEHFDSDFAWRGGSDPGSLSPVGNTRSGWRAYVRVNRAMRALRFRDDADRLLEALLRRLARSGRRVQATVAPEPGDPVIDPSAVREEAGSPVDRRRIRSEQKLDAEAVSVLEEWSARKTGGA